MGNSGSSSRDGDFKYNDARGWLLRLLRRVEADAVDLHGQRVVLVHRTLPSDRLYERSRESHQRCRGNGWERLGRVQSRGSMRVVSERFVRAAAKSFLHGKFVYGIEPS